MKTLSVLRPVSNDLRDFISLNGLWGFAADPQGDGESRGYPHGFTPDAMVAVPGSINEQLAERGLRDYNGAAWLTWRGQVPLRFSDQSLRLRFGSADLRADVWLNGELLGRNDMPFLPFDYEVTLAPGAWFTVVVRLDGRLDHEHPLPGVKAADYISEGRPREEIYPAVRYDFFPFLGLHRGVLLCAVPANGLCAVHVTTDFEPNSGLGHLHLKVDAGSPDHQLRARLTDADGATVAQVVEPTARELDLELPNAKPWAPGSPVLYMLQVELIEKESQTVIDRYPVQVGFRRVRVQGLQLCLNGEPLQLRGFGMHEDFPVIGKGECAALRVKDFELLRWIGANSFRTSHYAYAEETLDEADRRGVLVISEVASVNLDFRRATEQTLERHCQLVSSQMMRDRSHACVIAWSLTNEPGYLSEPEYVKLSGAYFKRLFEHARRQDTSRPLTAASIDRHGMQDPLFQFCDFISLNRYNGWYDMPGQLQRAREYLLEDLKQIVDLFHKPILLTEFGADAIPGMHSTADQLFSEEYQADFIEMYWRVIESTAGCIGGHVWNFADFRTAQHHRRVQFNHKGVFTRVRDPKMAAWRIRGMWRALVEPESLKVEASML